MKILNIAFFRLILIGCCYIMMSCDKFLDERVSHASKTVTLLSDLQALLDAENSINMGGYPFLLEVWTDDYKMDEKSLSNLTTFDQDIYKFISTDLYPPVYLGVWLNSYRPIAFANIVLESIEKIADPASREAKNIRGQALFHRAYGHFMLAQVFCLPYDTRVLNNELGIPLRFSSDANITSKRSTIKETYDSILKDMNDAVNLLNESNNYPSRPNKASAYAALSRIYLTMDLYKESEEAATKSLALIHELIDLNTLDLGANYPYVAFNKETIFFACGGGSSLLSPSRLSMVATELIEMFAIDDLRFKSYFRGEINGEYSFKGNYMGFASGSIFSGLTTSEVLLNRAECYARRGENEKARIDINKLLVNRIARNSFKPIVENNNEILLRIILDERRKELINRSVRWLDLRRLNKENRFKKLIVRTFKNEGVTKEYKLLPEPKNYVFKIPKDIIDLTGIQQN